MMGSITSIFFLITGVSAVGSFYTSLYFPIWLSVTALIAVSLYLINRYLQKRLGIILLFIWIIYALPFIHILPYLWFDFNQNPDLLWGLYVNPYMLDEEIIKLTAMLGAVGGIGIALGASLNQKIIQKNSGLNPDGSKRHFRTMAMPIWLIWIGTGIFLSALAAPKDTLFSAAYTESSTSLDNANFDSAWVISCIILTFTFCDSLLEKQHYVKIIKTWIISITAAIVLFYFNLLRGDRQAVPWIFSLFIINYYWAARIMQHKSFKLPWPKILSIGLTLLIASAYLGAVRQSLTGASLLEPHILIDIIYKSGMNLLNGTWSAVLLTPLSIAGDHIYCQLTTKWGEDYTDIILSIPPGFICDFFNYTRPLDAMHSPAWEMRYGLGGTHATVLPFRNFSMLGVFLIPAIWSIIIISMEKTAIKKYDTINLSLLGTIIAISPHWIWYSEKNIMNAIIIWFIVSIIYRSSIELSYFRKTYNYLN
jgi:hypothetical protein